MEEETPLNNCISRTTTTTTGHGSKKTRKTDQDAINLSFIDKNSTDNQVDLSGSCSSPWLSRPLDLSWINPREEEQQFKRDITKHNVAERSRREKINQKFIALSATIPGLKKADKASVLRDAVRYVNQLQAKAKLLEEQIKERMTAEYVVEKHHINIGGGAGVVVVDDEEYSDEGSPWQLQAFPEIEVEVSGKTALISVHCENCKGVVVKILSEIEGLNLAITNTNVMPFLVSSITVTVTAQVEEEFSEAVKDVVERKLKSALA